TCASTSPRTPTTSASASPRKRARCTTGTSTTARSTAKPPRRRRRNCTRKGSSFILSRCCPTSAIRARAPLLFSRDSSEIRHRRPRDGQRRLSGKERVWILGADQLPQWAFLSARQLRQALDRHLAHGRFILPEPLDAAPGHRKRTRILDLNVRLQHLAALDE